jgi:CBS domain-containing protein
MAAFAVTTEDRGQATDSTASLLIDDPTHHVSQLNLARKKPVSTKPTATISEAITLMMLHNFSQLPVMCQKPARTPNLH